MEKRKRKKRIIKLDKNIRFTKSFEDPINITLIQIIDEDDIPKNKFLFPDLNYKNGYELYQNHLFYIGGYRNSGSLMYERYISSGRIIEIENYEFKHSLDTGIGSSGSPICTRDSLAVIGMHMKGDKNKQINYGIFLGSIIDKLEIDIETSNGKKELVKKNKIIQIENMSGKIDEFKQKEYEFKLKEYEFKEKEYKFKEKEYEFKQFEKEIEDNKKEFEIKKERIIEQNKEIEKKLKVIKERKENNFERERDEFEQFKKEIEGRKKEFDKEKKRIIEQNKEIEKKQKL